MRIIRAINNNIISAYDEDGTEVLVVGKGVGFRAVQGKEVAPEMVEKVYRMSTQQETDRLKEMFATLPAEHLEVADKIITHAKQFLGRRLSESIYITLTDHINFAITRVHEGMNFQTPLLSEIKQFYAEEYAVGEYALQIIKDSLNVEMPAAEAASIALHIVNAEYDNTMGDSFHTTRLIERIMEYVQIETGYVLQEHSYFDERFLSHVKYLASSIIKEKPLPETDDFLYYLMQKEFPGDLHTAERIARAIEKEHQCQITLPEVASLAVHLKRIQG